MGKQSSSGGGVITNGPSFIQGLGSFPRVRPCSIGCCQGTEDQGAVISLKQPDPPWVPPYIPSTTEKNKTKPTHREKAKA